MVTTRNNLQLVPALRANVAWGSKKKEGHYMLVDMLEEVYNDIESEKAASAPPTDPAADEMTKALAESNKKIEELKTKFDKLAFAGSSIETTNNKEPEDGTETAKESEESNNENQNS